MRQKIGRVCMVLGALLILAAAALLAYNKWDASRADKASQEVLGELEQTLNAAIEEKAKSDTVALQPELDPTQEMTVTELNGWDYIGYLSIPSIGLELPVMSQWSYEGLKIAPGRYSGSTYADNMVVCAHNYAKHFSPIKWLTEGAQVYFTDKMESSHFTVWVFCHIPPLIKMFFPLNLCMYCSTFCTYIGCTFYFPVCIHLID